MSRLKFRSQLAAVVFCVTISGLPAQDAVPLAVKKVELYKNGMGYFEHLGTVMGEQDVEIVLPSLQLNDVLKSLTVLDLGHGRIGGVNYDSIAPLDRRLSEIPVDFASQTSLVGILNQIRGSRIEVQTPAGIVAGRLLGAEMKNAGIGPGAAVQEIHLSVYTAASEIQIVRLESAGALKFTEPGLVADLGRYLDAVNSTHQRDVRRLRIKTIGTGERQIHVSYTSESPIWKTTYRIILEPKQKPLLQGWAIVDNTTPMDWLDVTLTLTAGAPISFVQELSRPVYARRPVVPLPQGIQAYPQTHEGMIESAEQERSQEKQEGMQQFQGDRLSVGRTRLMEAPAPPAADAVAAAELRFSDAMRRQEFETAQAGAVAEQFEYRIKQPVTIRRNESALLPIIHSEMGGEKVAVYRGEESERNPRLAFWLKNSSGLALDAGPVTVIDSDSFAGEGLIGTLQPGESRILSYAVDLGTEISTSRESERRRVEQIVINHGTMRMYSKLVEKKIYKIRNNNDAARTVVIEHPVRPRWTLVGTAPVESSSNYYRFRVEASPKSTTDFAVLEELPQESSFAVSSITPDQIAVWVRDRFIERETEKALQAITGKKSEIDALNGRLQALEREQSEIFKDQERVRGNMQRLTQSPEEASLRRRYISQLEEQENRLAAIRTERAALESTLSSTQKDLDTHIRNLTLNKKL